MRSALLAVLALAACAAACSRGSDGPTPTGSAAVPLAATATPEKTPASATTTVIDFVSGDAACTLSHRGVLLDLGDSSMRARMNGTKLQPADVEVREHEGASWVGVHDRSLELSFVSPTDGKAESRRRRRGTRPRRDGEERVGLPQRQARRRAAARQGRDQGRRRPTPRTSTLARGANELLVRFNGAGRTAKDNRDNLAEIDWIRVGPADGDAPYAAPTRSRRPHHAPDRRNAHVEASRCERPARCAAEASSRTARSSKGRSA